MIVSRQDCACESCSFAALGPRAAPVAQEPTRSDAQIARDYLAQVRKSRPSGKLLAAVEAVEAEIDAEFGVAQGSPAPTPVTVHIDPYARGL